MPTPTYDLIEEKVLGSAQASVTFSSIPGTYKDLVIEHIGTASSGNNDLLMQVGNGSVDTGSNYSSTYLYGDGTTAGSGRYSTQTNARVGRANAALSNSIVQLQSYANTNVNKTFLGRGNASADVVIQWVALWRSTSAINIVTLFPANSVNFATGSTFRLWGVAG